MNYVLDVIFVNGRQRTNFDAHHALSHGHDGHDDCLCSNWTFAGADGNIERYFLQLPENLESELHVYKHVQHALSNQPIDFTLLKCIYEPQRERFSKPNEIWRRDVAEDD